MFFCLFISRVRTPVPWDNQACCGIMSPVRRTFCLLVTFDLIFVFTLWVIYTQVSMHVFAGVCLCSQMYTCVCVCVCVWKCTLMYSFVLILIHTSHILILFIYSPLCIIYATINEILVQMA